MVVFLVLARTIQSNGLGNADFSCWVIINPFELVEFCCNGQMSSSYFVSIFCRLFNSMNHKCEKMTTVNSLHQGMIHGSLGTPNYAQPHRAPTLLGAMFSRG